MKNFMLGAATSAHQVEGNNIYSDMWALEQAENSTFKEPSLDAVDHYNLYEKDLQILKDKGLNTYRFSIEWSRIEPKKGEFNYDEIKHYKDVLDFCHKLGITPIVTLHHFTNPKWLTEQGGWENEEVVDLFKRYVEKLVKEIKDLVPYICTINEANMGVHVAKIVERMIKGKNTNKVQVGLNDDLDLKDIEDIFNPGKSNIDPLNKYLFLAPKSRKGMENILNAHMAARDVIKKIKPSIKVGLSLSLQDNQALENGEKYRDQCNKDEFLDFLPYMEKDDFIGVQNYSRQVFDENGLRPTDKNAKKTKMGYEYYPKAIGNVVNYVSKHWDKEIIVTENGISTDNDDERIEFIKTAVNGLKKCIEKGINLRGYIYWSLLDNFEWQLGYNQNFGLIDVDRRTMKRYPKKSMDYLGSINFK